METINMPNDIKLVLLIANQVKNDTKYFGN
jgi:hypothetical protein